MDRKMTLEIEELEERIAPGGLGIAGSHGGGPPAAADIGFNMASAKGGVTVPSTAAVC